LSEDVTFNDLGTTELILRTVRASNATSLEVTSDQTTITCQMASRTVHMEIVGGVPGRDGIDGTDGAFAPITFSPPEALKTWLIPHGFGRFPSLNVVLPDGEAVGCTVKHLDENTVSVEFGSATLGTATLL
jgi:hypothetical protein